MNDMNTIEAALFAAGEAVSLEDLTKLVARGKKTTRGIVNDLIGSYRERDTGLEIIDLGNRYVMQVKPRYSDKVRPFAPKEMTAPLLRTLSMIAYHQPVVQSDLVDMRGNSAYDHIRDLKERGLVKAEPHGRTRLLSTTPLFADYFGLEENDPEAIRKKIIELSKEQSGKEGMDRWLGRRFIGFTPMFASLPELCGIKDFRIINAYSPTEEELAAMDTIQRLVISKGYREKVEKHYAGEILEAGSTTFEDLTEIMELLKVNGDPEMIAEAVGKIGQIREELVSKAMTIGIKAFPETDMIARILNDLRIGISPDGIRIAPDYGTAGDGREIGADADILVPTHDSSDEGLIERVTEKYECIIKGLKEKEGAVQGV